MPLGFVCKAGASRLAACFHPFLEIARTYQVKGGDLAKIFCPARSSIPPARRTARAAAHHQPYSSSAWGWNGSWKSMSRPQTGRKNLLSKLQKNFHPQSEKPFPVIIVDDAHDMEKQSFFNLCSFLHDAQSRTAAATLVLAGQPVLKKILTLDILAPTISPYAKPQFSSKPLFFPEPVKISVKNPMGKIFPHLFT